MFVQRQCSAASEVLVFERQIKSERRPHGGCSCEMCFIKILSAHLMFKPDGGGETSSFLSLTC